MALVTFVEVELCHSLTQSQIALQRVKIFRSINNETAPVFFIDLELI